MRKEDFNKGQTVFLLNIGDRSTRGSVVAATVRRVGRKYITVNIPGSGWDVQFDTENDFHQKSQWPAEYKLFLTEEEIEQKLKRQLKQRDAEKAFSWQTGIFSRLSDEDLESLLEIARRYER